MKKIKLIHILSLLLVLPLCASAQDKIKVVESSAKKQPVWVNGSETEYIITSATASDLQTARDKCLDNVRRYIIESVANNVKATTESTISQTTFNNSVESFLDSYTSTYESQAADVPFLKGISASKIEEYYWEKRLNKTSKEYFYVYSVKYPFTSLEMKKLVYEFEKRDKEIWGKYEELADGIRNIQSLEQIDRAIADLGPIINYLFDTTRKSQAEALRSSYNKLYSNITIRPVWQTLGEYRFQLVLDNKPIATSQRITLKSECASKLQSEQQGNMVVVRYAYDGCAHDDQNEITAMVKIGGKSVKHSIYYTIKQYDMEIFPERTIYLTAVNQTDSTLTDVGVRIFVKSNHSNPFRINTLTLEVPGLSEPLFIDNLNTMFKAKEATLNVTWIGTVNLLKKQNNRLNMLRGNMEIEVPEENIIKRVDFALPFQANW